MQIMRPTLRLAAVITLCGFVAACATKEKHSYAKDVNPAQEAQALTEDLNSLKSEQLDVTAPKHYTKAEKALDKANKKIGDEGDRTTVLNSLQVAKDEIALARAEGARWKDQLPTVISARQKALEAGAQTSAEKEFKAADTDLKDLTARPVKNERYEDITLKLQEKYMAAELKAIQHNELGQAREMVRTAREEGARRFAPQSLAKAETEIESASRQIEANRNEPNRYEEAVGRAQQSARALLGVTLTAKDARTKTPEEIALAIRSKEAEIARTHSRNIALESVTEAQDAALTKREQELAAAGSQMARVQTQNSDLEKEVRLNEKLKEIESKFTKQEADVYRQGENVVVRLKSIQFPNSRSELPTRSLPVLSKVNEVIAELNPEKVVIEGHTDSVGARDINQKISEERAKTVSEYLTSQNTLGSDRVEAVGFGFDKPLTTNKTKEGRAQNRRVDIVITPSSVQ